MVDLARVADPDSRVEYQANPDNTLSFLPDGSIDKAMANAERSVGKFPNSADAYQARSLVFHAKEEYASAINDLSKMETLVDDPKEVLFTRGIYYYEYRQFQNAKSDISRLISLR